MHRWLGHQDQDGVKIELDPNTQTVQKNAIYLDLKHNMPILGVIHFRKLQNDT